MSGIGRIYQVIARGPLVYTYSHMGTVPTPVSCMGIGWVQAQSWTTFSTHNFNAHASEAKVCGMLLP